MKLTIEVGTYSNKLYLEGINLKNSICDPEEIRNGRLFDAVPKLQGQINKTVARIVSDIEKAIAWHNQAIEEIGLPKCEPEQES